MEVAKVTTISWSFEFQAVFKTDVFTFAPSFSRVSHTLWSLFEPRCRHDTKDSILPRRVKSEKMKEYLIHPHADQKATFRLAFFSFTSFLDNKHVMMEQLTSLTRFFHFIILLCLTDYNCCFIALVFKTFRSRLKTVG